MASALWLDLVPALFLQQNLDGSLLWIHGNLEGLSGLSNESWESGEVNFWKLIHELDLDRVKEHWDSCRKTDQPLACTFRMRHAVTGAAMWVEERRRWITPRSGVPFYQAAWMDVTTRERALARLAGSAWARSLASLTPGLAHDLNNHFASILALSDTYVRQSGPGHPFHEGLKTIRTSVQDAARLVQKLVSLQAPHRVEKKYHDLNEIVRETLDILRHTTTRKVHFEVQLAPGGLTIFTDAVELRRVLIALARNAVEAMSGEGKLIFRTDPAAALASEVRPHFPGNRMPLVCFSITDTGPGVHESLWPRVFDPLQSTKPIHESCGFSLHLARRFAEESGGTLTLDSSSVSGATFRLWLPQSDLTELDRVHALDEVRPRVILVAGPEEHAEDVSVQLKAEGYRTLVTDGHALELVELSQPPLDAVLCLAGVPSAVVDQLVQFVRIRRLPTRLIRELRELDPAVPTAPVRPSGDLILSQGFQHPDSLRRIRNLLFPGSRIPSQTH